MLRMEGTQTTTSYVDKWVDKWEKALLREKLYVIENEGIYK